jgi:two-component system LytT family response regulator
MMATIRVVIVDGEPLARSHLARLLGSHRGFEVVGQYGSARRAGHAIRELVPDLVFLDLELPDVAHLDFGTPDRQPAFLLTTSQDVCGVLPDQVQALDCLFKPFDRKRFDRVLDRAKAYLGHEDVANLRSQHLRLLNAFPEREEPLPRSWSTLAKQRQRYLERVLVRDGDRIFFVRVDEIERIEAVGRGARIYSSGGQIHMLAQNLEDLAARLDPRQFLSIRRSTVVNLERLHAMEAYQLASSS